MRLVWCMREKEGNHSGPTVRGRRLLCQLAKMGHDVHCIILLHGYGQGVGTDQVLSAAGVKVHMISEESLTLEDLVALIVRCVEGIKPDAYFSDTVVPANYAARYLKAVGIQTFNTVGTSGEAGYLLLEYFSRESKLMDHSLVISKYLYEKYIEDPRVKTQLFYLPTFSSGEYEPAEQTLPLHMLYLGRMGKGVKRVDRIFELAAQYLQQDHEAKLTMLGEGHMRQSLIDRSKKLACADRIEMPGHCQPETITPYVLRSNVLLLFSKYEGLPNAVIDAMQHGVIPIALKSILGVEELIVHGKTGYLIEDNYESLAEVLDELKANPELRHRVARNARQHIIDHYDLAGGAERLIEIIQSVQPTEPTIYDSIPYDASLLNDEYLNIK